jgi:chromosome segregation ATPase
VDDLVAAESQVQDDLYVTEESLAGAQSTCSASESEQEQQEKVAGYQKEITDDKTQINKLQGDINTAKKMQAGVTSLKSDAADLAKALATAIAAAVAAATALALAGDTYTKSVTTANARTGDVNSAATTLANAQKNYERLRNEYAKQQAAKGHKSPTKCSTSCVGPHPGPKPPPPKGVPTRVLAPVRVRVPAPVRPRPAGIRPRTRAAGAKALAATEAVRPP